MGWLLLAFLTSFALLDAVGLALLTRARGRAELGIAAALFFAPLIGLPVLVLGYANVLWRATLALVSLGLCSSVFWLLARQRGSGVLIRSCAAAFCDLAGLPLVALREAMRARSVVFVGLLAAAGLIATSLVLTYLIEFC